ncbi:18430_t:CDS:2 [Entrophospora sp. SA101]|nr:18430_t:CDS:2 [Entrophospora sp. SA101]
MEEQIATTKNTKNTDNIIINDAQTSALSPSTSMIDNILKRSSISTIAGEVEDGNHKKSIKSNDDKCNHDNNNNNNDHSSSDVEPSQQTFPFTPHLLYHLFDPKNLRLLKIFGGTDGIIKGLHTNIETGLKI